MSRRRVISGICVFATLLVTSQVPAFGQNEVGFRNSMQTIADVTLTRRSNGQIQTFTLTGNQVLPIPFSGDLFDIQVIPRDEPNSGFRFLNVNLQALAGRGRVVNLRGEFAAGPMQLVCYKRCFRRCKCCWQATRGERTAVTLEGNSTEGAYTLRSPKMKYADGAFVE